MHFVGFVVMMLMTFKEDGFLENLETKSGRTMTRIQMSSTITARGWENIFREFVCSPPQKDVFPWFESITEEPNEETDILQSIYIWILSIWYFAQKKISSHGLKTFPKKVLRTRQIFCSLWYLNPLKLIFGYPPFFPTNKQCEGKPHLLVHFCGSMRWMMKYFQLFTFLQSKCIEDISFSIHFALRLEKLLGPSKSHFLLRTNIIQNPRSPREDLVDSSWIIFRTIR